MKDETIEKTVDECFKRISDITYYTANTAKEVILKAYELKMTPTEYLAVVSSYISDFEKEGKNNENY